MKPPAPHTDRLAFARLRDADAPALAEILADPEVARGIMAKATTPDRCLSCATSRIAWHNSAWDTSGLGVWGLQSGASDDTGLIGWCGFTPSGHGGYPEILYGIRRSHWGRGLAREAAQAAIAWAFDNDMCDGIDALIFARLNPGSVAVAKGLSMRRHGQISMSDFLPDADLGRDVLEFELWRIAEGAFIDFSAMIDQVAFKCAMLASTGICSPDEVRLRLRSAVLSRRDRPPLPETDIIRELEIAFDAGLADPALDIFRIERR